MNAKQKSGRSGILSGLLPHPYGHRSPLCFTFICALFHGDKCTTSVHDTSPPAQHAFPLALHY